MYKLPSHTVTSYSASAVLQKAGIVSAGWCKVRQEVRLTHLHKTMRLSAGYMLSLAK